MDIHDTRQLLRSKSIYEIPLRVTFYARVSSESDEQLNSLGNQVSYYEDFIRKNSAWDFVPGYVDEGLSGISTKHRENFHRMVDDAAEGLFDLILTKEISRFARNTLDSIRYTRELLTNGVAVFFQNDNINTLDDDAELRLSIMSSIAQDELRKLSSRVKFGHQQAIKHGVVLGNNNLFGYTKKNGRLEINEQQAPMVRQLFEYYASNEYSLRQLETIFWDQGYRNRRGNRISHTTFSNMISNPKYKGYYVGNKVTIVDMFSKQQKFLPPEQWVMHKDETGETVPAIVSEELWENANRVLRRRSDDVKNRQGICNHTNLLTGKLCCTHCGRPYYRRDAKDRTGVPNSRWICSGRIMNGIASCPSIALYEDELKPVLLEVFRDSHANTDALIEGYTSLYRELVDTGSLKQQNSLLEKQIDTANKKKSKLLEFNVAGKITDNDFLTMTAQANAEIAKAEEQLKEIADQAAVRQDFNKHMEVIRSTLQRAQKNVGTGIINRDFIEEFIDKIMVTVEPNNQVRLDIRLFTGEETRKYLEKLHIRTGHTFKKMIEAYEQGMQ